MSKLLGKVAIITGASRGIGRAIAIELRKEGASVVINYSKDEEGNTRSFKRTRGGSICHKEGCFFFWRSRGDN